MRTDLGAKACENDTQAHDERPGECDQHGVLVFHDERVDEYTSTPCQAATDGADQRH